MESIHIQSQILTAVSPHHPVQDSHSEELSAPGQDRSWWVRVGWCSLYVAQGTKRTHQQTLSCASVWVLETRERHRFLWQSVSHPNHGNPFLLLPSALHRAPQQTPINGTWQGILPWQKGSESPGWESLQTHWKNWGSVFLQHSAAGTGTLIACDS